MDEVENLLFRRLNDLRVEKTTFREQLKALESKLRSLRAAAGPQPRETEQELQRLIEDLEREYSVSIQSKASERSFFFQIDKLKQKKVSVGTFNKYNADVILLKDQLSSLRSQLYEKERLFDEISIGLRKTQLANRLKCSIDELDVFKFEVDQEVLPRLIGKNGFNFKRIENEYSVGIEIENKSNKVRLIGIPSSIESAKSSIEQFLKTISEEISPSLETLACLSIDGFALKDDLQHLYNVRIDVNLKSNTCKIKGYREAVVEVKSKVLSIESAKYEVFVDQEVVPVLLAKTASKIKAIEVEHKVLIKVDKEKSSAIVMGLKSNVKNAVSTLNEIISSNKSAEEAMIIEKRILIGCFLSSERNSLRAVSKEFSVKIDIVSKPDSESLQILQLKGIVKNVQSANERLKQIIGKFTNCSIVLDLKESQIPIVLGKGGSTIKALREKYPDSRIDFTDSTLHIYHSNEITRHSIRDEINEILRENFIESISSSLDFNIMLKSPKGSNIRRELLDRLGLRVSIEDTAITLKGSRDLVLEGKELLRRAFLNYSSEDWPMQEDDIATVMRGAEESVAKLVGTDFNVEIFANRKDGFLKFKGEAGQIKLAKAAINELLLGSNEDRSVVIHVDKVMFPVLIGKAGSNINKMEAALDVKLDLLESRNQVRIRGKNKESISTAKETILSFLFKSIVVDNLDTDLNQIAVSTRTIRNQLQEMFRVELIVNKEKAALRGTAALISEAKMFMKHFQSESYKFSLPILSHQLHRLENDLKARLTRFQSKFQVQISFKTDQDSHFIVLVSSKENFGEAKRQLICGLNSYFPHETAFIELSRPCLHDLYSENLPLKLGDAYCTKLHCDWLTSILWLAAPTNFLNSACNFIETLLSEWKNLNCIVQLEDNLIPLVLGKSGENIATWMTELSCNLEIERESATLLIKANSSEELCAAREAVEDKLAKIRSENWFFDILPEEASFLIGKSGSNIQKLRDETGANITIDSKSCVVKAFGLAEKVKVAKEVISSIIEAERSKKITRSKFKLAPECIPILIGTKGEGIRKFEEATGTRIDIDKATGICSVKGRLENCSKCVEAIERLLKSEEINIEYIDLSIDSARAQDDRAPEATMHTKQITISGKKVEISENGLSKSALKRLRKKLLGDSRNARKEFSTEDVANEINLVEIDTMQTYSSGSAVDEESEELIDTSAPTLIDIVPIKEPKAGLIAPGLPDRDPGIIGQQLDESSKFMLESEGSKHLVEFLLGRPANDCSIQSLGNILVNGALFEPTKYIPVPPGLSPLAK